MHNNVSENKSRERCTKCHRMHHTKYDILRMKNNRIVYHIIKLQQIHTNATATM